MADVLNESSITITDATGAILIQGATDKRMTVLSIHICETAGNDETFSVWRTDLDGSSNPKYLYFWRNQGFNFTYQVGKDQKGKSAFH